MNTLCRCFTLETDDVPSFRSLLFSTLTYNRNLHRNLNILSGKLLVRFGHSRKISIMNNWVDMRAETVEGFQSNPHQSRSSFSFSSRFILAFALPMTMAFRKTIVRVTFRLNVNSDRTTATTCWNSANWRLPHNRRLTHRKSETAIVCDAARLLFDVDNDYFREIIHSARQIKNLEITWRAVHI